MAKKIDLTNYTGKTQNSQISAEEWNSLFQTIENTINEEAEINGVTDVLVNNESVVSNSVANISIPVKDIKVNGESVLVDGIANINLSDSETTIDNKLYINGVEKQVPTDKIVHLAAGEDYVIKGYLNGQIIIGTSEALPESGTSITLEGFTLVTDAEDAKGISYEPDSKSLTVTLAKGTINKIICSHEAEMAESQKAALYSEKNMTIQGTGALAVKNLGGHGIKASELRISGRPHIYAEAIHDGLHGNSALDIYDGYIHVVGANDALGTGTTGRVHIFGGEISTKDIKQNVIDSKNPGYIFGNAAIKGKNTITSGMTVIIPEIYYGKAVVDTSAGGFSTPPTGVVGVPVYDELGETIVDVTPIEPVEGVYTYGTKETAIVVRGFVEGTILLTNTKIDVIFDNAYLKGSIKYDRPKSRVKIKTTDNSINFIHNIGDAIVSSNNGAIECKDKSYICITSDEGCGFIGDEITLNDSAGVIAIKDCGKVGLKGKDIYIGTASEITTDVLKGSVVITNNHLLDVLSTFNSKCIKGAMHISDSGLKGVFVADKIKLYGEGVLDNCNRVSYRELTGIISGDCGEDTIKEKIISL